MSINPTNPRQIAPLYITEPLPNGRRRCTWKKLDCCDYATLAVAALWASYVYFTPGVASKPEHAFADAVFVGCLTASITLIKKICEYTMPFSCRDYCMMQHFPERYGVPNYNIQENL